MDIRKIKKLIELIEESGISEIEIKEGEESVRLSRHATSPNTHYFPEMRSYPYPSQAASSPLGHTGIASAPISSPPQENPVSAAASLGHKIKSPMVGTMYTSPSPDASPFVSVGQAVKSGDTLCIIEAMKMFNEIESDRDGIIREILIKNGDPVEFDQVLFILE